MAYTQSQKRASRKYNEKSYDRIGLYLPKNDNKKEMWQAAADEMGISMSELIIMSVDEYIGKKGGGNQNEEKP